MFFNSGMFWFMMGAVTILIGIGFKTFTDSRGWNLNWWKWLLTCTWYAIFSLNIYTFGTLAGENETSAGFRIFLLGLFICLVSGVGLWRLLMFKPGIHKEPEG